jgi:anti-sigma factor RsiW
MKGKTDMRCKSVTKNLAAYLDNELSQSKARKVSRHLSRCGACKLRESQLRQSWSLLDALKPGEMPENLASIVQERITIAHILPKPYRQPSPLYRYVRYAVAAGIILTVTLYFLAAPINRESPPLTQLQAEVVRNLELLEHLDILENPELMKELDILLSYEEEDFESS